MFILLRVIALNISQCTCTHTQSNLVLSASQIAHGKYPLDYELRGEWNSVLTSMNLWFLSQGMTQSMASANVCQREFKPTRLEIISKYLG